MTGCERQLTHRRRGFTLTEVMMVAAIVPLMVGVFAVLADQSQQTWMRTDTRLAALTSAQHALDRVSEELRRSSRSSLTCVDGGTIRFALDGAALQYFRNDAGELVRREIGPNGTIDTIAAGGLTEFAPTCEAGGLVRLRVAVRVNGSRNFSTQTLESRVFVMIAG